MDITVNLSFLLLYCSVCMLALSKASCPADCRCSHTSTAQLVVFCRGKALRHVTSQLPAETVIYQYEAHEREVNLGGTNFSHLTSLESLQLTSPYDQEVLNRIIKEIPVNQQKVFHPLTKLKELNININWKLGTVLPELFTTLDKLEVLDLSNTRILNYVNLKNTLYGLQNSTSFKSLSLQNTQTMDILSNGLILNLTDLLDPLKHCSLQELDISYNALRTIIPGLISKAPQLRKLDASNNLITHLLSGPFFFEVLIHPALVEVDLSEQGLGEPKRSSSDSSSSLHEMIHEDTLTSIDQTRKVRNFQSNFLYQQNKDCFDAVLGDLCNAFSPECAEALHEVTVSHTLFCEMFTLIMPSVAEIPCDFIPPALSLLSKDCGGCFVFPSIGNVRILHLQRLYNYDEVLASQAFENRTCFNHTNSVEVLDFSHNHEHGYSDIDLTFSTPIHGFDRLKVCNLSNNGIQHPSPDLGYSIPQLEVLDLSYNLLNLEGKYGEFLTGAISVQELNLAGNTIQEISYNRFSTLSRLQTLNLSRNSLQSLSIDIHNLSMLSYVDLNGNKILSLPQDMITQLSAQAAKLHNTSFKIDLSQNSLLCTCSMRHFTDWVLSKPYNIEFVNFHAYMCLNEASNQVPFHRLDKATIFDCLSRNFSIGIGVGSGILLTVIVASVIKFIYRKRWWIRYHYFIARNMWIQSRKQEEESNEFRYDVFVSYNKHDKDWVDEVLQPKLEGENRIRLCLHERDFELGGEIMEQVIDSIEKSRKTLLILSPHFVQSNWCKFEMKMAQAKLFRTGHDVLLLAILKPLDGVEITKTLKELLEQKTYVEWSEDQYGQKLFWKKLIAALNIPKRWATVSIEEDGVGAVRIDEDGAGAVRIEEDGAGAVGIKQEDDIGAGDHITDDIKAPLIQHTVNQPLTSFVQRDTVCH